MADAKVIDFLGRLAAVKKWVEVCLAVRLPDDALEFVRELKSGILLGYLVQKIDPRAIPKICEDKAHVLKLRDNVDFFVAACRDEFQVPRHRLLSFADLERGRVVPVVDCLVELAAAAVKLRRFRIPLSDPVAAARSVKLASVQPQTLAVLRQ
jgi:hypothetical protein